MIVSSQKERKWFTPDDKAVCPRSSALAAGEQKPEIWQGFGGCFTELSWRALRTLDERKRKKVLDDLFLPDADGLRLCYCRLPVGANDYADSWYSYDETPGDWALDNFSIARDEEALLPFVREALARRPDMQLFASPWSPPSWMKNPPVYNYGRLVWTEENLTAYARYLVKYLKAYAEKGVRIHALHVQNEPVSNQKFPSCVWEGRQLTEFIGKYLGPLMEKETPETKPWLGTINGPENDGRYLWTRFNQYANDALSDPDAAKYIGGVAYQWAGKAAVRATRESYPSVPVIQSENECGDGENSWEYARYIFELFRNYLSDGVCAYCYWNMALLRGGESTWGWRQNSMITVENNEAVYNHEYYVMKHFSRFIQPGARRRGLTGPLTANAVLFENPDGSRVLTVMNPFAENVRLDFEGRAFCLPADSVSTVVLP